MSSASSAPKPISFQLQGSSGAPQTVAVHPSDSSADIESTLKKIFAIPIDQDLAVVDESGHYHPFSGSNLCAHPAASFSLVPLAANSNSHSNPASRKLAFPPRPAPGQYDETEKQKMLRGEMYLPLDPLLSYERERARVLLYHLNNSPPVASTKEFPGVPSTAGGMAMRKEIYKELFTATSAKSLDTILIEPPFFCDYGCNIEFGENVMINFGACFLDCNWIKIGSNTLIAPNVGIFPATHPVTPKERNSGREYAKSVIIGESCWLGGGSIIIPGVKIGNNVVVGAGAVVTKDVPDNCIVVGNPARILRTIDV